MNQNLVIAGGEDEREVERRRALSTFLKTRRLQIDADSIVLGEYARKAAEIGSPVTPAEIADASGVNCRWYELAECGEPVHASSATLRSIGGVLRLSAVERAELVQLAIPGVDRDKPLDDSVAALHAFSSLQRYARKLYDCSTVDEAVTLAEETTASFFPEVPCVFTASRLPSGCWTFHGEGLGRASRLREFALNRDEVVAPIFSSDPLGADTLMCFPQVSAPGEIVTYDDYDEKTVEGILGKAYSGFKAMHEPMLAGIVHSRTGIVAHLYLGGFLRFYGTEADRAIVCAVVDFLSLAPLTRSPGEPSLDARAL